MPEEQATADQGAATEAAQNDRAAVEELAKALGKEVPKEEPTETPEPEVTPEPEAAEPESEEPPADNFLDVAEAAPVYTIEQVREAIVGYQKKTGDPEKARKLLKTVGGVDTLRSLPENKFGAIIEACKK